MKTSPDLIDLADVCAYFGLSESTIRRKVRESRAGISNFPLPLLRSRCRVLWRKSEIEAWGGRGKQARPIATTTGFAHSTSGDPDAQF